MILLFDIGNTNTHLGLAGRSQIRRHLNFPTASWFDGTAQPLLRTFAGQARIEGAALCSVVPRATPQVRAAVRDLWRVPVLELGPRTISGVGINYPRPETIGPDRLANAVAVRHHVGAPSVVVDKHSDYVGGIIAPGLAAMTDYLHEKTALLPRIKIREIDAAIGKNTEEAMLIGAVHGYRGLIRELLLEVKRALRTRRLPVVATGGYARLIATKLPEITAVMPLLTLEGLRLVWRDHFDQGNPLPCRGTRRV